MAHPGWLLDAGAETLGKWLSCRYFDFTRQRGRFRNRLAYFSHGTQMKLDGLADKAFRIFYRFTGRNAALEIRNISGVIVFRFFNDHRVSPAHDHLSTFSVDEAKAEGALYSLAEPRPKGAVLLKALSPRIQPLDHPARQRHTESLPTRFGASITTACFHASPSVFDADHPDEGGSSRHSNRISGRS